jgi:hypothetical protein
MYFIQSTASKLHYQYNKKNIKSIKMGFFRVFGFWVLIIQPKKLVGNGFGFGFVPEKSDWLWVWVWVRTH